jgi:hypothetical protein
LKASRILLLLASEFCSSQLEAVVELLTANVRAYVSRLVGKPRSTRPSLIPRRLDMVLPLPRSRDLRGAAFAHGASGVTHGRVNHAVSGGLFAYAVAASMLLCVPPPGLKPAKALKALVRAL